MATLSKTKLPIFIPWFVMRAAWLFHAIPWQHILDYNNFIQRLVPHIYKLEVYFQLNIRQYHFIAKIQTLQNIQFPASSGLLRFTNKYWNLNQNLNQKNIFTSTQFRELYSLLVTEYCLVTLSLNSVSFSQCDNNRSLFLKVDLLWLACPLYVMESPI